MHAESSPSSFQQKSRWSRLVLKQTETVTSEWSNRDSGSLSKLMMHTVGWRFVIASGRNRIVCGGFNDAYRTPYHSITRKIASYNEARLIRHDLGNMHHTTQPIIFIQLDMDIMNIIFDMWNRRFSLWVVIIVLFALWTVILLKF